MKTLSLTVVGLLISAVVGLAAPGAGTTVGAVATGSGGHASGAAPAAHGSAGSVGVSHSTAGISPSAASVGNGFRPSAGLASGGGSRPGFASNAGPSRYQGSPVIPAATVRNAWSDPANPHVGNTPASIRASGQTTDLRPGNHLYPGAYGYTASRPAGSHPRYGQDGDRGRGNRHRYYNNFPYCFYYPYPYGNYGYSGTGYDGNGLADYSVLSDDSNTAGLGAPDFTSTPNNYYSYVAPTQPGDSSAPQQPLPDAPEIGPQNPAATAAPSNAPQGPDSLVEAVQDELSRRGYFGGKSDAIYGASTKEAIRRFQTDQSLPATGRINEATLHALHLD